MTVRPYVLLSDAVLGKLRACLLEAVGEWSKDWGLTAQIAVECEQAAGLTAAAMPTNCYLHYVSADKKAWFATNVTELEVAIRKNLFPSDRRLEVSNQTTGSIASATAKHAAADVFERLASTLGFMPTDVQSGSMDIDSSLTEPASGAVLVQIQFADRPIVILMNHSCLASIVPAEPFVSGISTPLIALSQALADVPVVLPIEIGRVELDVASLISLGIGDVVRLPASVDAPLEIRNESGTTLFNAYLGKRNGSVALEVAGNSK